MSEILNGHSPTSRTLICTSKVFALDVYVNTNMALPLFECYKRHSYERCLRTAWWMYVCMCVCIWLILSRLYYSDCELSTVNTGSVWTCDLSAGGAGGGDCHAIWRTTRASFVCVSSLVVSRQRLYWTDVGLGLIASAPLINYSSIGTVRALRWRDHRCSDLLKARTNWVSRRTFDAW